MVTAGRPAFSALTSANTPFDQRDFRRALGRFGTGVAVVTTICARGTRVGMTVTSFNTVSLHPPLVLFSVDRRARSLPHFLSAEAYAVNVLADHQEYLSNRFAKASSDKWQGVSHGQGRANIPLLLDAVAHFECVPYAHYEGGDHLIMVGEVQRYAYQADRPPLIFLDGSYRSLAENGASAVEWPLSLHY
ncbi:MAG: flavin reductase family protein [Chelatococcus sp.]|uniref:flavin reductase family protein n=1 Tax=Chelatococcus sp. TaxID=1953771 RepID=UPI0025BF35B2|nr:flavin reductase family protein [Chelatococcus sp.]MBX3540419.1 flavin reductase family protein [Chelatococcus sp.]